MRAILAQAAAAKQLALAANAAASHSGLNEGGGNGESSVAANVDAAIATVPAAGAGDRVTPAAPTATAASVSLPPPPPPKQLSSDAAGVTTPGEEGNETEILTPLLQSPPPPAPLLRELSAPPTLPPTPPPKPLATAAAMGTDAASVESDAGGAPGPAELEQPASSVNVHCHIQAPAGATAASAHDAASVVTAPATGGGKGGAAGAAAATSAAVEFASCAVLEGEYELEKVGCLLPADLDCHDCCCGLSKRRFRCTTVSSVARKYGSVQDRCLHSIRNIALQRSGGMKLVAALCDDISRKLSFSSLAASACRSGCAY